MSESKEQIIRYLQEEMNSDERADFESQLAQSADLQDSVSEMRRAIQASQMFGQLKLRNQLADLDAEFNQLKAVPIRSFRLYWVAAASVLLVALVGLWYCNRPPQYFAAYFEPYAAPVDIRSGPGATDLWVQARVAYAAGDFSLAAERFSSITNTAGVPTYLRDFYWGLSLLSQEEPDFVKAIALLENVAGITTDYEEPATWLTVR